LKGKSGNIANFRAACSGQEKEGVGQIEGITDGRVNAAI
jgi:hypothetical protein